MKNSSNKIYQYYIYVPSPGVTPLDIQIPSTIVKYLCLIQIQYLTISELKMTIAII